jgi:group II intron reverse transcriptase/maturase
MSVTRQEQRKAQGVDQSVETPLGPRAGFGEVPYTDWIASVARSRKNESLNNLFRFFNIENLRQAYAEIDGSKAVGSDGITKEKYGRDLEANLQDLHQRMRRLAYRPASARLVFIPKPDGRKRPIAISNFEDKLVQKVAADILTAIYDPTFKRFSFGFRPGRSCHGAIGYLYNKLRRHKLSWVVDVDLKDFFNTIDHKKLLEILSLRISDKMLLRYLGRMLRAGILVQGTYQETESGTPQGSIVSPILANIFLHHVLDEWFTETTRLDLGGEMVRYADDVVAAFASEEKAQEFVRRLEGRLGEYGLSLNRDKTHIIGFDRESERRGTFDFLGFTFYWGRWGKELILKVRTSMKTFWKKVQDFTRWIKENRSRYRLEVLWEKAASKLQGHYNYFGVLWNRGKLHLFYYQITGILFRWLNRRSQKLSYTWEGFKMRLSSKPLPQPAASTELIQLTDPRGYCA